MSIVKKVALGVTLAAVSASAPVLAHEKGDFIARAGWARVMPDTDSDTFSNVPGAKAEVDDADSLGLTFTYMFTDNIGLGVLAAYPFTIDIKADGSIKDGTVASEGKIGDTHALPPTVTMQYFFDTGSKLHPYLGAGVNYTFFWDEDGKGAVFGGTDMDLDNSWGFALEAGMDIELDDNWLVSAQAWYIQMDTTADSSLAGKADIDINPFAFVLGVGKKF